MSRYGAVFVVALGLLSIGVGNADAQRQGFIAGLGLGLGSQLRITESQTEARGALITELKIGSQVGQSWQVYFRQVLVPYPAITGLTGIGAGYEFPGRCALATGTVGVAVWGEFVDGFENGAVGPGLSAGLGCEVAPHLTFDFDIVAARVYNSHEATLLILKLGVSVLSH